MTKLSRSDLDIALDADQETEEPDPNVYQAPTEEEKLTTDEEPETFLALSDDEAEGEHFYEVTNEHGFLQVMRSDSTGDFPVCSSCHVDVMLNRGQGTMCSKCIAEDILMSEAML